VGGGGGERDNAPQQIELNIPFQLWGALLQPVLQQNQLPIDVAVVQVEPAQVFERSLRFLPLDADKLH
jgi:hypothetical protein